MAGGDTSLASLRSQRRSSVHRPRIPARLGLICLGRFINTPTDTPKNVTNAKKQLWRVFWTIINSFLMFSFSLTRTFIFHFP